MFRYRLYWQDGEEAGEATYVSLVKPGEAIWVAGAKQLRVVDVVELEPGEAYAGLLMVEAA